VPTESQRLRRRISRRDRWFLALVALLALVGTPGTVLLLSTGPRPSPGGRCVTTVRASVVGGATYTYCGTSAVAACRRYAADDKALAAQCEKLESVRRGSETRHRPAFSTLVD